MVIVLSGWHACVVWLQKIPHPMINKRGQFHTIQAGHSVRARPNPIPNLEVKPDVAVVLLRCESSWEATVLALFINGYCA